MFFIFNVLYYVNNTPLFLMYIVMLKHIAGVMNCRNVFTFLTSASMSVHIDTFSFFSLILIPIDQVLYALKHNKLSNLGSLHATEFLFYDMFVLLKLSLVILILVSMGRIYSKVLCLVHETLRYIVFMFVSLICITALFSVLVSFILPCEPIIYDKMEGISFARNAFYYTFRLFMNFTDFSRESYHRLSVIHVVFAICVMLFFFNFLIALLSDHVSVISADMDYHFEIRRLFFTYQSLYILHVSRRIFRKMYRGSRKVRVSCSSREERVARDRIIVVRRV